MAQEEEGMRKQVVLAKPFSLEDEKNSEHTTSNLIQRILSLFKNVRPGSDLTNFQLPPQLNLPRSQLQCYGEMVYSFNGQDLLGECGRHDQPIERLKSIVTWNISTLRPLIFGLAPYNPIVGETHHVSNGHVNVLVEQANIASSTSVCSSCNPRERKHRRAYVDVEVKGKRVVKLLNEKETYEMNQPRLVMTFLPVTGAHWAGKIVIKCLETGLEAELQLLSDSFLSRFTGNNKRSIKGKIFEYSSGKRLYELFGHWDRTVTAKNLKTGELEVIYNASEHIAELKTPIVKNLQEMSESESAMVWSEVSEGIMNQEWEKAREGKRDVEEKQRESRRQREASGQPWIPKHFSVVRAGKDWDCVPLQPRVPQAPIVVPL
ncbi:hypothetical protein Bca4012_011184 [Brassica carinata]